MAGSATRTSRVRQSKSPAGAATSAAGEVAGEATIRERAYHIWEAEGRPSGRHDAHWLQAEHELRQNAPASSKAKRVNGAGRSARAPKSETTTTVTIGAAGGRGTRTEPGSAKAT